MDVAGLRIPATLQGDPEAPDPARKPQICSAWRRRRAGDAEQRDLRDPHCRHRKTQVDEPTVSDKRKAVDPAPVNGAGRRGSLTCILQAPYRIRVPCCSLVDR